MEKIVIKNFINGDWQEEKNAKTVPLYNPSTGEVIGEVPMSGKETCEKAIASAAEAYKTWRLVPLGKRMGYIYKIRELMERDKEKIAQGIALDQAKQIAEAKTSMVPLFAAGLFYFVFNALVAFVMERIEKKMSYYR